MKYHDKGFKIDKYLHLYIQGKGTMGNGTFQNVSEDKRHFILWETGHSTLWESDHLSSGNRDIIWETGHGKRDTLSSGIRTTYPLGNILRESGIWEMRYNQLIHIYSLKTQYFTILISYGFLVILSNFRNCYC